MRLKFLSLLGLVTAIFCSHLRAADEVLITEFMAANSSILRDEDNAFSDWVEIYNAGTNSVNLNGWALTDNAANLTKWLFPATNLPPNNFMVVFASGKNRRVPGAPLHTSFSLAAGGEYLALVKPDGVTKTSEFAPQFPNQFSDVAYGLVMTGPTTTLLPANTRSPTGWVNVLVDGVSQLLPTYAEAGAGPEAQAFDILASQIFNN